MSDASKHERFLQMFLMAYRIVDRCKISTRFALGRNDENFFLKNLVACRTEGRFRGQTFTTVMPITTELYEDLGMRARVVERAQDVWRKAAVSNLVPVGLLMGPKGKLPR